MISTMKTRDPLIYAHRVTMSRQAELILRAVAP
jgi:hypothetical protein